MSADAVPSVLDPADFDAVGVASDLVVALRTAAIERNVEAHARVIAPDGWHDLVVNCSPSGQLVLRVRFEALSASRHNNVSRALADRGWQLDEDGDGAAHRHRPGAEAMDVAFEVLSVLTVGGAPPAPRPVQVDRGGAADDAAGD